MSDKQKIVIEFTEKNSAAFSIGTDGEIIPMQLLAVAGYLEFLAKSMLNDFRLNQLISMQEQQAEGKILRPKTEVITPVS